MKRVEWLWLALIVATGVFLRLYRLDDIPPGLTHDEADVGYHAAVVYETGQRHVVDQPYGFIHQPFVQYSGALLMRLFGPTDVTQRLHSALFGTLLIAVTYVWARRAFDAPIALTAAAFMAAGFWPLMTSRFALNNQPVPAIFGLGVWLLWRAVFPSPDARGRGQGWGPLAGLFLGLSVYPYEAGRVALASIPIFALYLFALRRFSPSPFLPRSLRPIAAATFVALLVAAPHLLDPRSWGRTGTLVSETVGAGGVNSLIATVLQGFGTIFVKGDPFVTYNLPDRPVFDPILAVPFVIGVLIAVRRWRDPAYGFTLIWLIFGLAPTLVVGAFTSTIHSIAAQTPVFVLLGIGLPALARFISRQRARIAVAVVCALVAYSSSVTFNAYFDVWAESPAVRAAYYTYFASMMDEVNARTDARDVAMSSAYPDKPLDPFIAARRLRRSDVRLRHFDARRAIVFPDSDSGLLLIPALTPIDPALAERLDLPAPEIVRFRPDDLIASFDEYDWNPRTASNHLAANLQPLSSNFNNALELIGAEVATPQVKPGGEVVVISLWRVIDPAALGPVDPTKYDRQAALFAHLLGADGRPIAQDDRLDAPVSSWHAGDTFAQVHRFVLKPETAPGTYPLVIGVYTLPSQSRLPVSSGGDTVTIGQVEVSP